jgi:hypothetical protein
MIVQDGKKFTVMGESGRKMGTYGSRAKAEKRLAQVEMFKRMKTKRDPNRRA